MKPLRTLRIGIRGLRFVELHPHAISHVTVPTRAHATHMYALSLGISNFIVKSHEPTNETYLGDLEFSTRFLRLNISHIRVKQISAIV